MFQILAKTMQLWSKGVRGVRVFTAQEVEKYRMCSADNTTKFEPYKDGLAHGCIADDVSKKFDITLRKVSSCTGIASS